MDNSNNFEQQFTQNLKATAQPVQYYEATPSGNSGNSKLSLVVIVSLAAITLVESIVLLITLTNYFSAVNNYFAPSEEYSAGTTTPDDEEEGADNTYIYDDNENLTAMDVTCTTTDGNSYKFTNTGTYTGGGTSGTYTITNDSLVSLSGSGKVLYYDGFSIADGLTIYECEENAAETNAE